MFFSAVPRRVLRTLVGALAGLLARTAADVLELLLHMLGRSERLVVLPLAPGLEAVRWHAGRLRARRTAETAAREVPAYRDLLAAGQTALHRTDPTGLTGLPVLDRLPVTDKTSYVTGFRLERLCRGGRLPARGLVLDESSGSSGTPTSWARGRAERRATSVLLRATFRRSTRVPAVAGVAVVDDVPVVLNAFSLGAWATGMSVTSALAGTCRLKSVGPDRDKVVSTMLELGPGYRYVVLGYPPFLKDVADDPRIDLTRYDVTAGFGGEGISENMRTYLLRRYRRVVGSYGASDLESNLAAETDMTIALRRRMAADPALHAAVTGRCDGPLPMVFQYNPLDYVLETTAEGELLVTVARRASLSPRLRYNIHDLGRVIRTPELRRLLAAHGAEDVLDGALDLPVLLHGGRSDASVDFYGAVVTVDEVREALYAQEPLASAMRSFRLVRAEDPEAAAPLVVAVELQPGEVSSDHDARALGSAVLARLRRRNGDLDNACKGGGAALPTLELHAAGTGPFADGEALLKHRYVAAA
ncbi:hypothetical protein [Jannaschia sp. R86511]|uniref:hypothetical protein n=1 Tax=Jannaschia sp. R86511 TaxID=3093853 RepID=UPI0036D3E24E